MTILKYQELEKVDFNNAIYRLRVTDDISEICNILLSIGMYYRPNARVEELLYDYFSSENIDVARSAILGFGHLTRRKKFVDKKKLIRNLENVRFSIELQGTIEDLLDDINVFANLDSPR